MRKLNIYTKSWYLNRDFSCLNSSTIPKLKSLYSHDDVFLDRRLVIEISVSLKNLSRTMNDPQLTRLSIEVLSVSTKEDFIEILMRTKEIINKTEMNKD